MKTILFTLEVEDFGDENTPIDDQEADSIMLDLSSTLEDAGYSVSDTSITRKDS